MLFFWQGLSIFFFSTQKPENLEWPKSPNKNCPLLSILTLVICYPLCYSMLVLLLLLEYRWAGALISKSLHCGLHLPATLTNRVATWLTYCFLSTSLLAMHLKLEISSTSSHVFFHSTHDFLSMLLFIIFILYCLCSSLKCKVHKSEGFCLFVYCYTPSSIQSTIIM